MGNRTQNSIIYRVVSEVGNCRNINQDAVLAYAREKSGIFVVADGMGGHSDGEYASNEIIKACRRFWNNYDGDFEQENFTVLLDEIERMLKEVNRAIFRERNNAQVCGSTVIVLLLVNGYYAVLSVGDSRIYTCAKRKCTQLTVDDIWDNLSSTRELYSEKEIVEHKNRGKLVHAVGISEEMNVYVQTGHLHKKQAFLLCSDGLYKCCEEQRIQELLKKVKSAETMETVLQEYRNKVYLNGARDNFSVILVRWEKAHKGVFNYVRRNKGSNQKTE